MSLFRHALAPLSVGLLFFWEGVRASSMFIAKMCRGVTCQSPNFPILDYNADKDACECWPNPCWNVNGTEYSCSTVATPYLTFSYEKNRTILCSCSSIPFHPSIHMSRDLCPGQACPNRTSPVLDYDDSNPFTPVDKRCVCRQQPCWNVDGRNYTCSSEFPILRYREELVDNVVKPICECIRKLNKPQPHNEL